MTRDDAIYTQRHLNQFYCTLCLNVILPYSYLDDEGFFEAISEMELKQTTVSFQILQNQELVFSPFDFDIKSDTPLHDPDIQFYSDKYSLYSCDYYLEGTFNDRILQKIMSKMIISPRCMPIYAVLTIFRSLVYQSPGLKNTR